MKPTRTCIVCRTKNDKDKLIRIVSDSNNNAVYDKYQNINSRAIYICKSLDCCERLQKILTKNKFKVKIVINNDSLSNVIEKIENELGE